MNTGGIFALGIICFAGGYGLCWFVEWLVRVLNERDSLRKRLKELDSPSPRRLPVE